MFLIFNKTFAEGVLNTDKININIIQRTVPCLTFIIVLVIIILGSIGFVLNSCTQKSGIAMKETVILDFPLKGTWITPNTPGKRVPSHGTTKYGETYAYDFVKVDVNSKIDKFYNVSLLRYLFRGAKLDECFGWGSEIYAPCDGEVVIAEDGVVERNPVKLTNDIKYMRDVTTRFENGMAEYREVAGNYIILKIDNNVYALFAHIKKGTIKVKEGQRVKRGDVIGNVGHSGNSTAPHLHFQIMDNPDPMYANGLPCAFFEYEKYKNGKWVTVHNGVPGNNRIRKE
jgi:murein DD-endopeptidase MepM/ murein hydrolase activator NlpD